MSFPFPVCALPYTFFFLLLWSPLLNPIQNRFRAYIICFVVVVVFVIAVFWCLVRRCCSSFCSLIGGGVNLNVVFVAAQLPLIRSSVVELHTDTVNEITKRNEIKIKNSPK